jgi:acetyl-CoA carboxylase alpha subunit
MAIRDEDRAEAERLKPLPRKLQREIIETIRRPGDDPDVSAENRREARRRAKALEELLRLKPKTPKS